MARAYQFGMYGGKWIPVRVGPTGTPVGSGGDSLPAGDDTVTPWSYAADAGGITNTTDVTLVAATEVVIKSGSTVLWRARFGVSMIGPVSIEFKRPLVSANNTA